MLKKHNNLRQTCVYLRKKTKQTTCGCIHFHKDFGLFKLNIRDWQKKKEKTICWSFVLAHSFLTYCPQRWYCAWMFFTLFDFCRGRRLLSTLDADDHESTMRNMRGKHAVGTPTRTRATVKVRSKCQGTPHCSRDERQTDFKKACRWSTSHRFHRHAQ